MFRIKGPLDRTKVVLRHLPPTISQSALTEHVDSCFSGRYRWLSFHPGKSSQKHLFYSRAYIDFNRPEDVVEFAEYFDGHVFVNEKGTQIKTIVEYAPSQRVPKQWSKKDGREGTILKDPEYQEFLEFLAKPIENLPSAEIQLERKESERAGASKDAPIVTPLMDFVRQKRAAKSGSRRSALNGKQPKRSSGPSSRTPSSGSSRRGSEKRTSSTMYISRGSSKSVSGKDKSTYILVKRDDQQLSDNSVMLTAASGTAALEEGSGGSGLSDIGKKKILLLKGKERESSTDQRREASGRVIRSILLNKDSRQGQSSSGARSEQEIQISNQDMEKKPPRPPNVRLFQKDVNGAPDNKSAVHAVHSEKRERRTRNKDRPDRGVWTPLRHSDSSHASDESLSSYTSQTTPEMDSAEVKFVGTHGEMKIDMPSVHGAEFRPTGSGRRSHYSVDNGSYRHVGRRGSAYNIKDTDGPSVVEGKSLKRGGSSGYGSHEKQVWIQKSSSGS